VGAWNTLTCYVIAAVTFSGAKHPAEDQPHATSEGYAWFRVARGTAAEYRFVIEQVRDEHLAQAHEHCEHGPFPEPECP